MTFLGIQVYEILENGNLLNAIYTNTGLFDEGNGRYGIDIEIARKKKHDDKGVEGVYDCRYIETGNTLVAPCELEISKYDGVYKFTWRDLNNKVIWTGLGLMAGTTHIAVSYE